MSRGSRSAPSGNRSSRIEDVDAILQTPDKKKKHPSSVLARPCRPNKEDGANTKFGGIIIDPASTPSTMSTEETNSPKVNVGSTKRISTASLKYSNPLWSKKSDQPRLMNIDKQAEPFHLDSGSLEASHSSNITTDISQIDATPPAPKPGKDGRMSLTSSLPLTGSALAKKSMHKLKASLRQRIQKMVVSGPNIAAAAKEDDFPVDDHEPLRNDYRARRPRSPRHINNDMFVMDRALVQPPMSAEMIQKKMKKTKVAFNGNTEEPNSATTKTTHQTKSSRPSSNVPARFSRVLDLNTVEADLADGAKPKARSFKNFVRCRIMTVAAWVCQNEPNEQRYSRNSVVRMSVASMAPPATVNRSSVGMSSDSVPGSPSKGGRKVGFGETETKDIPKRESRFAADTTKRSTITAMANRRSTVTAVRGLTQPSSPQRRQTAVRKSQFRGVTTRQGGAEAKAEEEVEEEVLPEPSHPVYNLSNLARDLNLPLEEVQRLKEIFEEYDADKSGEVDESEFSCLLEKLSQASNDNPIPQEMLRMQWREVDTDGSGGIIFPEFAKWYSAHGFHEEMLLSPNDRLIRNVARKLGFPLMEVERIKKQFDVYDEDGSGEIELAEFERLLYRLLKVPKTEELPASRVRQFWSEIDQDRSGCVDFEEFLCWYTRYFSLDGRAEVSPIEEFYKSIRFPRKRPQPMH